MVRNTLSAVTFGVCLGALCQSAAAQNQEQPLKRVTGDSNDCPMHGSRVEVNKGLGYKDCSEKPFAYSCSWAVQAIIKLSDANVTHIGHGTLLVDGQAYKSDQGNLLDGLSVWRGAFINYSWTPVPGESLISCLSINAEIWTPPAHAVLPSSQVDTTATIITMSSLPIVLVVYFIVAASLVKIRSIQRKDDNTVASVGVVVGFIVVLLALAVIFTTDTIQFNFNIRGAKSTDTNVVSVRVRT